MAENILYYGDNLEILRRYIENESIDLVHLDPPFKSDQDYNILFAERNGSQAAAQINPILPARPEFAEGLIWPTGVL